jgi:hypothetical protein
VRHAVDEGRGLAGPGEGGHGAPEGEQQFLHQVVAVGPGRERVRHPVEEAGMVP